MKTTCMAPTDSYNDAVHGYDVSVLHDEDTNKIEAVV